MVKDLRVKGRPCTRAGKAGAPSGARIRGLCWHGCSMGRGGRKPAKVMPQLK